MQKKVLVLLSALVVAAMVFAACRPAAPAVTETPAATEAPVEAAAPAEISVVIAQIIPDDAVQSLPESEILGYVYQDEAGGVTSTFGLDIPSDWDGTKPPQPMYTGEKSEGAEKLFCELDVNLSTNEQTVYRCGYPGKG